MNNTKYKDVKDLEEEIAFYEIAFDKYHESAKALEKKIQSGDFKPSEAKAFEYSLDQIENLSALIEKKQKLKEDIITGLSSGEMKKLADHQALQEMKYNPDAQKYLSPDEKKELAKKQSDFTRDIDLEKLGMIARKYHFEPSRNNVPKATMEDILFLVKMGELKLDHLSSKEFKEKTLPLLDKLNWKLEEVKGLLAEKKAVEQRLYDKIVRVQDFNTLKTNIESVMQEFSETYNKKFPARYFRVGNTIEENPKYNRLKGMVDKAFTMASNRIEAINMYNNASNKTSFSDIEAENEKDLKEWKKKLEPIQKLKQELEEWKETIEKDI